MPSSRDIPWKRLIAEGTAIVLSILLAFGIDAWWDERKERIEEQQILQGLNEEFSLIRDVLKDHKHIHLGRLQALEDLLAAFDVDKSKRTTEVVAAGQEELLAPTTSDISNGTLRALLSSGRLEIIENERLRKLLVGWEISIEEVWDDQRAMSKLVYEIHAPYFISEGHGVGEVVDIWHSGNTASVRSIGEDAAEVERLLNDPRFQSMVEHRYLYKLHLTEEFESAIAAADEILAEINESIKLP